MRIWVVASDYEYDGFGEPFFAYSNREAAEIHALTGYFAVVECEVLDTPAQTEGWFQFFLREDGTKIRVSPFDGRDEKEFIAHRKRHREYSSKWPEMWSWRPHAPMEAHFYGIVKASSPAEALQKAQQKVVEGINTLN